MTYQEEQREEQKSEITSDSGGARGYTTLSILFELMRRTREPRLQSPTKSSFSNHGLEAYTPNAAVHSDKYRSSKTGSSQYQSTLEDAARTTNSPPLCHELRSQEEASNSNRENEKHFIAASEHSRRKKRESSPSASGPGTIISIGVATTSASIIQRYESHSKTSYQSFRFKQYSATPGWKDKIHIQFLDRLAIWAAQAKSRIIESAAKYKSIQDITKTISAYLPDSDLLTNPPPLLFLLAVLAFALAITHFRHLHRHDRYQDCIIICFEILGILAATQAEDIVSAAKGFFVWSVITGLLLSFCLHRLMGDRWGVCVDDNEATRLEHLAGSENDKHKEPRTRSGELT